MNVCASSAYDNIQQQRRQSTARLNYQILIRQMNMNDFTFTSTKPSVLYLVHTHTGKGVVIAPYCMCATKQTAHDWLCAHRQTGCIILTKIAPIKLELSIATAIGYSNSFSIITAFQCIQWDLLSYLNKFNRLNWFKVKTSFKKMSMIIFRCIQ